MYLNALMVQIFLFFIFEYNPALSRYLISAANDHGCIQEGNQK